MDPGLRDLEGGALGRWRTAIAGVEDDRINVRGFDLADLISAHSFAESIFLVLTGQAATSGQARMLDGMLTALVDHGISPSSTVTRFVAASGVPLQASIAAGLLTIGDIHGGANEEMAFLIQIEVAKAVAAEEDFHQTAMRLVKARRKERLRVPGFGHPQHKNGDSRVDALLSLAHECGVAGDHLAFATALEEALSTELGITKKLNIDGVLAAILSDLGLNWRHARAIICISRAAGLAAHAIEEVEREQGWRQIPLSAITYDGPPRRNAS